MYCKRRNVRRETAHGVDEDLELPSDSQDQSAQILFELNETNRYKNHLPHRLIGLMYELDLSVLRSIRKVTHEHKYPSLSIAFEDSVIDKFNNIVIRYEEKYIAVNVLLLELSKTCMIVGLMSMGNKTQYLDTIEKEGIDLSSTSSILSGAGANGPKALEDLYEFWFNARGNKKQFLKHFTDDEDRARNFMLPNLSSILGRAGANAKDALERLHSICFTDKEKRTKLLDDSYEAGFRPSNVSSIL